MRKQSKNIKDKLNEQFLPRIDKYNSLNNNRLVPVTNQSMVIIPCLTKTYGFKTNTFKSSQRFLIGVISDKQFNSFVRRANQIIQKELINKSVHENQPFFNLSTILLKVSIILLVLALILLSLATYTKLSQTVSDIMIYISVLLLGISSLVAGLCPIFLYRSKYSSLNYDNIIRQKLKQLQAEQNKLNISKKVSHITWRIQRQFYWIQLHINRINLPNITNPDSEPSQENV